MVSSLNKVLLIGDVGKDPEIRLINAKKDLGTHESDINEPYDQKSIEGDRVTKHGKEMASFTLMTVDSWFDKGTNIRKEKREWHRIIVFVPHIIEMIKKNVRKGMRLFVEGSLQTRLWKDAHEGVGKYTTEILVQHNTDVVVVLSDGHHEKYSKTGGNTPEQES